MSDIFISYASADRERAGLLADALSQKGWLVWWDRTIPPGKEFDQVIEEALDAAKCVVVLWSKTSTASSWVKTEAAEAMRRKILVPALIDETKIPLEFRRLQAADLSQWQGESSHPELEKFFQSIEANLSAMVEAVPEVKSTSPQLPVRPQPVEPARPLYINREQQATKSNTKWVLGGIGIVALVAMLGGYFFYREHAQRVALEQRIANEKQEQAERERIAKEEAAREAASRKAEEDRRAAAERAAQQKAAQEQAARAARTRAAQQPTERVTPPGVYPAR